jgi:hypothetical protein
MAREAGDGGPVRLGGSPAHRAAAPELAGRNGAAMDVLILAAEPGADVAVSTSAYPAAGPAAPGPERERQRLVLYLLRMCSGVLVGGAAMLATVHWTHLDIAAVKDAFLAVLIAVMTLVSAAAGFYYGAADRRG